MSIFNRRSKKASQIAAQVVVDPDQMLPPETAADYQKRGYAYYARNRYPEAEADLKKAIELDPKALDAYYALGMTYKATKRNEDGIQTFQKVIELLDQGIIENQVRTDMLHRLAMGHINEIGSGDWNLEKEIWHKE